MICESYLTSLGLIYPIYKIGIGTSLVVQWNLPCNAEDAGSIPGRGIKIPHATGQLSPRATTKSLRAATKTQHSQTINK